MATTVFGNPITQGRVSAKAPKVADNLPEDPEKGEVKSRSESPIEIAPAPPRNNGVRDPLFIENTRFGLTGKGKKSRKHKKRAAKKTQKRRAKK